MDAQTASPTSTEDATPDKPRRRPVHVDYDPDHTYDPRSHMVAGKHLPLVVGFSYVTAWRKRRAGTFPAPIRISVGRVAWLRSDLEQWLAERQAASK